MEDWKIEGYRLQILSPFSIQYSVFSIQYSVFSIQYSVFSIQYSVFKINNPPYLKPSPFYFFGNIPNICIFALY